MHWADVVGHKNLVNSIEIAFASIDVFLIWRYLTLSP